MRYPTSTLPLALALCLAGSAAAQCDQWELAATSGPSQRQNHDMAYDGQSIMLFAGQAAGATNDETWLWDGASWRQSRASGPLARSVHKMAYDPGLDRVILFGGSSGGALDDTWAWDAGTETWTQLFPAVSPPARFNHAMAYDAARGHIVMFGGFGATRFSDTWVCDGGEWKQVFPATSPPGRNGHAMAYDPIREVVVLFGGFNGPRLNDTWEWDGETWTQSPATGPAGRQYLGMAFHPGRGTIVLACGQLGPGTLDRADDTWEYDGTEWRELEPGQVGARDQHAMAYYPDAGQLVLHGGYGGAIGGGGTGVLEDTWVLSCDTVCRPDCDESGALDFFDFLCFQDAFADPTNPYGDFDGNGARDFFDFLAFQDAFAAGCP
jgi:hypothetical protein